MELTYRFTDKEVTPWGGMVFLKQFLHTETTRADSALAKIFEWERVPGQDAYKRFFSKFSEARNIRVSDYFLRKPQLSSSAYRIYQ